MTALVIDSTYCSGTTVVGSLELSQANSGGVTVVVATELGVVTVVVILTLAVVLAVEPLLAAVVGAKFLFWWAAVAAEASLFL